MIEEEGLDKVRSVDLKWHFFEEVLNIETVLSNLVNDKSGAVHLVKVERLDCSFRKSVALKWVKTILRLCNVIDNHNRVDVVLVRLDHLSQVEMGECETKLAAYVKTNVELVV